MAIANTYVRDSRKLLAALGLGVMPTIRLDKIGTIGSTHGVSAKPNPAKKKTTTNAIKLACASCWVNQLASVP